MFSQIWADSLISLIIIFQHDWLPRHFPVSKYNIHGSCWYKQLCPKHWCISRVNIIYWSEWRLWHYPYVPVLFLYHDQTLSPNIYPDLSLIFANLLSKPRLYFCFASPVLSLFYSTNIYWETTKYKFSICCKDIGKKPHPASW